MTCGEQEHQSGQKCPAKNAKCKDCHKIGHFHKVCQPRKELNRESFLFKPPRMMMTHKLMKWSQTTKSTKANMLKLVNHIEANRGRIEGKHLKFSIASHPKGPYKYHIVVRVDTGADVNSMNEKTFNELFPEVQLSVFPHEIQNFGNSVAGISILGQVCTYWEFRGAKYLNIFIVTFRMGVLLPNYPEENVAKGDNVPNFSKVNGGRTGNGTAHGKSHGTQNGIFYVNTENGTGYGTLDCIDFMSNVFQILN